MIENMGSPIAIILSLKLCCLFMVVAAVRIKHGNAKDIWKRNFWKLWQPNRFSISVQISVWLFNWGFWYMQNRVHGYVGAIDIYRRRFGLFAHQKYNVLFIIHHSVWSFKTMNTALNGLKNWFSNIFKSLSFHYCTDYELILWSVVFYKKKRQR